MPRTERLEYENAYYHVMNRGRGRQNVFHGRVYFEAFLDCLAEAHERFAAHVHAYCLMSNHYHLLISTPLANISRIMRHVNGVYTQRYNRLKRTDGPLFRGRFKSIIVDADAYLLQVSRYIHRNPIDTKQPLVKRLEHYPWSSYSAYINQGAAPNWLYREQTYQVLGKAQRFRGYQQYVEEGLDEEIRQYYGRGNILSVIGDKSFREALIEEQAAQEKRATPESIHGRPEILHVMRRVAKTYKLPLAQIRDAQMGARGANLPRKYAMYLAQQVGYQLREIAEEFGVNHTGSISHALTDVRKRLQQDLKLKNQLSRLKKSLW